MSHGDPDDVAFGFWAGGRKARPQRVTGLNRFHSDVNIRVSESIFQAVVSYFTFEMFRVKNLFLL